MFEWDTAELIVSRLVTTFNSDFRAFDTVQLICHGVVNSIKRLARFISFVQSNTENNGSIIEQLHNA